MCNKYAEPLHDWCEYGYGYGYATALALSTQSSKQHVFCVIKKFFTHGFIVDDSTGSAIMLPLSAVATTRLPKVLHHPQPWSIVI